MAIPSQKDTKVASRTSTPRASKEKMAIPSQKTNGGDARGTGRTASREARKSTEAPSKPTAGADIKGKAKKKTTDDKATLPAAEELCEYRQTDWRGGESRVYMRCVPASPSSPLPLGAALC